MRRNLAARWMQLKGSVKSEWGKLTDDDLTLIAGKRDQLVGKLQGYYGLAKDQVEKQVDTLIARIPPAK